MCGPCRHRRPVYNLCVIRRLLLVATLLLLTACAAAKPPPVGTEGQKLQYRDYALTVTAVDTAPDFPGARKARAGNKLVAVEILIESTAAKGVHWDPDHARLVTRDGVAHRARNSGKTPAIERALNIARGESLRGWVTYEVPAGTRVARFKFEAPQEFDNVMFEVELKLS